MGSLIKKNAVIKNNDGYTLRFTDKVNVTETVGIPTNNFLSIFVKDLEDSNFPGVSALERVKTFLAGDLSVLVYDYDMVDSFEQDIVKEHKTEIYEGYSIDAEILHYTPTVYNNKYCDIIKILLRHVDPEFNNADLDRKNILDLQETIVDSYEMK